MKKTLWFVATLMVGGLMFGCGEQAPAPEAQADAGEAAPTEDADGFRSIFDGESLEGWKLLGQSGEGYLAQDGMIVCPPKGGGNLFYEEEFSDFELEFEFRLEEGSNNGLCIRCPIQEADMAYAGIELQIIDNSAERYEDIKPWQKHGSLYHVFPAKTGALAPVGEWNRQRVKVQGRSVQVTLNDQMILDADLDEATDPEILEKHPGLQRTSGHVGFLGHGEPLQFRNIRIKEL